MKVREGSKVSGGGHNAYQSPHLYTQLPRPNDEIRVSRGAERVSDNKKRDVLILRTRVDAVCLGLDNIAIGQNYFLLVKRFLRQKNEKRIDQ